MFRAQHLRKGVEVVQAQASGHVDDPCLVLGRLAVVLADRPDLAPALDVVREGFGLDALALLGTDGSLLAGTTARGPARVELPVPGRHGSDVAVLVAAGARPGQLAALRSAAAVVGLALSTTHPLEDLDADRDAIADALHDGPVQALVVARYASDAAVRGADPATARDAVQSALVEARRFLWQLRPRGGAGLLEALDQLSSYLVEGGGRPIGLVGDVDAASALRGPAGALAYRLVQAVSGVQAPAVRVAVRAVEGRLRLQVDGGGELPHAARWAARARALGGDLQTHDGGVRLDLPYPDPRTAS